MEWNVQNAVAMAESDLAAAVAASTASLDAQRLAILAEIQAEAAKLNFAPGLVYSQRFLEQEFELVDGVQWTSPGDPLTDVPNLSFPVEAGRWTHFRFFIVFTVQPTTAVNAVFAANGPTFRVGTLTMDNEYPRANGSGGAWRDQVNDWGSAHGNPGQTVTSPRPTIARLEGAFLPTANGRVNLQMATASPPSNTIAIKLGSGVEWFSVPSSF